MPPPSDDPALTLLLLKETYFILQFKPDDDIPANILELLTKPHSTENAANSFVSITRTSEEISIVYNNPSLRGDSKEWCCIKIKGPMHLGLTGIMCDFTAPLKHAGVPIFALSTWNTDYILVPERNVDEAVAALQADGWTFDGLQ